MLVVRQEAAEDEDRLRPSVQHLLQRVLEAGVDAVSRGGGLRGDRRVPRAPRRFQAQDAADAGRHGRRDGAEGSGGAVSAESVRALSAQREGPRVGADARCISSAPSWCGAGRAIGRGRRGWVRSITELPTREAADEAVATAVETVTETCLDVAGLPEAKADKNGRRRGGREGGVRGRQRRHARRGADAAHGTIFAGGRPWRRFDTRRCCPTRSWPGAGSSRRRSSPAADWNGTANTWGWATMPLRPKRCASWPPRVVLGILAAFCFVLFVVLAVVGYVPGAITDIENDWREARDKELREPHEEWRPQAWYLNPVVWFLFGLYFLVLALVWPPRRHRSRRQVSDWWRRVRRSSRTVEVPPTPFVPLRFKAPRGFWRVRLWTITNEGDELVARGPTQGEEIRVHRADAPQRVFLTDHGLTIRTNDEEARFHLRQIGHLAVEYWLTGQVTPRTCGEANRALIGAAVVGAALCLGLASWILMLPVAVLVVVDGCLALSKINRYPRVLERGNRAILGIVIGIGEMIFGFARIFTIFMLFMR